MKYLYRLLALSIVFAVVGCSSKLNESPEVMSALDKAGKNRGELEKVLKHYSKDPEKLEAARWLILNMHSHYSVEGDEIDSLEKVYEPLLGYKVNFGLEKEIIEKWNKYPFYTLLRKDDIRSLKADYLIDNIDRAYDDWKNISWNKNLSFDEFCELLLPYNIGDARIRSWRKTYADHFRPKLDSIYQGDDVVEAAKQLCRIIIAEGWKYNDELITPHRDANMLFNHRVGCNRDYIDMITYAMRGCGIPVAIDQLLISPESKNSHKWVVVKDTKTGRYIPFGTDSMEPDRDNPPRDKRKKGKVYRVTYGEQKSHEEKFMNIRSLPLKITQPFLRDVTDEYFAPDSATVPVFTDKKNVYLALPVLDEWLPIDAGKVKKDSVTFKNFEGGVFYVPVVVNNSVFDACGYPFYTDYKFETHILKPDTIHKTKIVMERTMPLRNSYARYLSDFVIGAVIEGSEDEKFTSPDTLMVIEDTLFKRRQKFVTPFPNKEYSYLRYSAPRDRFVMIGELELYSDRDAKNKLTYSVTDKLFDRARTFNLYDNNLAQAFTIPEPGGKFHMKLDNKSTVGSIRFTARNDGNFPIPGHNYELLYQDGPNGWKSVGKCIGSKDYMLEFTVPGNALLKLVDLSSFGSNRSHKQVFTILNGKIVYSLDFGFFNLRP